MSEPRRTAGTRVVALLAGVLLAGCGPALWSVTSYRGHRALDAAALETLERMVARDEASKGSVLTALGPPVSVLGQDDGEIFVYLHTARDTSMLNLNPGYVVPAAPSVPLYHNTDVSGRHDLLMIFFDADGKLRGASVRHAISDVEGSRAATLSEGIRGWVE